MDFGNINSNIDYNKMILDIGSAWYNSLTEVRKNKLYFVFQLYKDAHRVLVEWITSKNTDINEINKMNIYEKARALNLRTKTKSDIL